MPPEAHFSPKAMGQELTDIHFQAFESKDGVIWEIHRPSANHGRTHIRK